MELSGNSLQSGPDADVRDKIQEKLFQRIDISTQISDSELLDIIREEICIAGKTQKLNVDRRLQMEREIFNALRKLDVLQKLIDDPDITEIMINGENSIFIEKHGKIERTDLKFYSREKLENIIQIIVGRRNQVVNESSPIVDTRLDDGSRVSIVLPPVAIDAPIVTIRRFSRDPITMQRLIEYGSISDEIAEFIGRLVAARYNIFVSGGTGSGKTTFLNAMTEFIPQGERVITIEDDAELQVIGVDNLVRLEARNANLEGNLEVSIRDLVKASLRMRPDRIIVGECRGAEALEVLQANNTGHDGSLSTGHANSAEDMISRLETMVLMGMDLPIPAIRKQIASGIDIFIHLIRLPDGRRRLEGIAEVDGMRNGEIVLNNLYEYREDTDDWMKKGDLIHCRKMSNLLLYRF